MNTLLFEESDANEAILSGNGLYRYTLTREWGDGPCVGWMLFNPSTADATRNDPTIRKCMGFSKRWGFGRMVVLNMYAIRSTDPKAVGRMGASAVGPLNDYWILESVKESRELILAWGCAQHSPTINIRVRDVIQTVLKVDPYMPLNCLGYRQDGHPRHPLMLKYDTPREPFIWRKN